MFGREYLDWTDRESASASIDAFLAEMPAYERKWALAVLRDRFEVRVEYRDSPLLSLARAQQNQFENCRQVHPFEQHRATQSGGVISALARDLGL